MNKTRIGFIGLGLIGGSIAKAIRKFHPEYRLLAYSFTRSTLDKAVKEAVIDIPCTEKDSLFATCDYIFLCAPVQTNISYLPFLKQTISSKCVLTDVGSVKGEMHNAVAEVGLSSNFIGGHPMAGSEKTGFSNSRDYLLENAYYVITPSEQAEFSKISAYADLVASLGAIPLILSYEEHDYMMAGVSHLPHIVASCLVNAIAKLDTEKERMKLVAAGGFKDITRIASSSPVIWTQICLTNKKYISKVLDEYIQLLIQAKYLVDQGDGNTLYQMFEFAKNYRDSLSDIVSGPTLEQYVLYCDIYDKIGGIATITTLLAMNDISIKNINIIHNRECGEGVLRIEFYEEKACKKAMTALKNRDYQVHTQQ